MDAGRRAHRDVNWEKWQLIESNTLEGIRLTFHEMTGDWRLFWWARERGRREREMQTKGEEKRNKTFSSLPCPLIITLWGEQGIMEMYKMQREEGDWQTGRRREEEEEEEEEEGATLLVERFHIKRDRNIPLAV